MSAGAALTGRLAGLGLEQLLPGGSLAAWRDGLAIGRTQSVASRASREDFWSVLTGWWVTGFSCKVEATVCFPTQFQKSCSVTLLISSGYTGQRGRGQVLGDKGH